MKHYQVTDKAINVCGIARAIGEIFEADDCQELKNLVQCKYLIEVKKVVKKIVETKRVEEEEIIEEIE